MDPATRKIVYIGHSKDVPARIEAHWIHRRHPVLNRQNPQFYAWLQSLLMCPGYRVLATVPYSTRYQAEREWTLQLRKTCDLFNISDGAAPVRRGPRPAGTTARRGPQAPAHREKIGAALRGRPRPPEVRAKIADAKRAYWAALTPEERSARNKRRGGNVPSAAA